MRLLTEEELFMEAKQKRARLKPTILIIALILILLIIVSSFIFDFYSKKQLPNTSGETVLDVTEEVKITTDNKGIPHIEATNNKDLFFAQGYAQARDRLFQMDLSRRQASGTLSELVGAQAVDNDKYFRTLGLRRAAKDSLEIYPDDAKAVLNDFTDGVNAFIEEASEEGNLPLEYTLLGVEPQEWSRVDSLTIGKYMAFDLGGHWERQAFNAYLLQTFDDKKAYELFPTYPKDGSTVIQPNELNIASSFEDVVLPDEFNGSNNWVVDGDKTASGKPLLADDPHLGLSTPSIWYEMSLQSNDVNVAGVIFAGVPGIILGHNEDVAWGVTNTGPDVQQLFVEKQNPDKEYEFLFNNEWEPAKIISEPIQVKGEDTIEYEVVETRHGPIISDFSKETNAGDIYSLQWTALEPTTELLAILQLNKASNWSEFEKGLENFLVPAQNFVFMDNEGTIAYKANGNIPIYENETDSLLPLPGWDKDYELTEYIPFDELPKVVNPDKGYIATANNKITPEDYPYHISNVWAQPYRYDRISEVLDTNDKLTVEDMENLQMDPTNLRAREFVPYFIDILKDESLTEKEEKIIELMEEWDFTDVVDLAQPLIFDHWFQAIEEILFSDIPDDMMELFSGQQQTADELIRKGNRSIWVDEKNGIEEIVVQSFKDALARIEDDFGTNMNKWKWR